MVADTKLRKIHHSTKMLLFKLNELSKMVVWWFLVFDSKQHKQLSIGNLLWQDWGEVG